MLILLTSSPDPDTLHINSEIWSEWTARVPPGMQMTSPKHLFTYYTVHLLVITGSWAPDMQTNTRRGGHNNRVNEIPRSTPCSPHTMRIMCFKRIQLCVWSWSLTLICPASLHLNHLADEGSLIISTAPCLYFRHTNTPRRRIFFPAEVPRGNCKAELWILHDKEK